MIIGGKEFNDELMEIEKKTAENKTQEEKSIEADNSKKIMQGKAR